MLFNIIFPCCLHIFTLGYVDVWYFNWVNTCFRLTYLYQNWYTIGFLKVSNIIVVLNIYVSLSQRLSRKTFCIERSCSPGTLPKTPCDRRLIFGDHRAHFDFGKARLTLYKRMTELYSSSRGMTCCIVEPEDKVMNPINPLYRWLCQLGQFNSLMPVTDTVNEGWNLLWL